MSIVNTHFGAEGIDRLLCGCKKIFFIGIGGVSMSSLAHISRLRGFSVEGSDRSPSKITKKLCENGIKVHIGHEAENVSGCDAVVYTLAIGEDNPEYVEAKRLGIPAISRADYLGYIMTGFARRLGVSGMHGKSSCTGMCAAVFMAAGADPTVVSGASYPAMGGFYRIGGHGNFIFEACEYKDSFLDFNPTDVIILNAELEHVDYFADLDAVISSFAKFAALTGENGNVIANADDENVLAALRKYNGNVITYGYSENSDFKAENIDMSNGRAAFDIYKNGEYLCSVALRVPGRHNIMNALAVSAAADLYGLSAEAIGRGLSEFCGIKRRMEYRGKLSGAEVFDDYGHHPTEITATLEGARALTKKRLVCAFQSHTYSRTKALFDDFVAALTLADEVLLAPIYAAREANDPEVSSERLAAAIGKKATAYESTESLVAALSEKLEVGDLLVIMGAGDIDRACEMIEYDKD
ncbi:MAG: UDP-N-acetylmuramate--L-alanine ligase [Ruminococcaceae bacterium]|nr:UDP-N-acetylmuramate--L-alanine ligase [Oscillospiraceae bacterium]